MALIIYRLSSWLWCCGLRRLSRIVDRVGRAFTGCVLPGSARVGLGSTLAYGGISLVVHKDAVIGCGVLIGQGITLGAKEGYASSDSLLAPTVENNCYLAAGCRIIGGIRVGENSIVATNAVVLADVPPGSVVAGVPARVVGRTPMGYKAIRP